MSLMVLVSLFPFLFVLELGSVLEFESSFELVMLLVF